MFLWAVFGLLYDDYMFNVNYDFRVLGFRGVTFIN